MDKVAKLGSKAAVKNYMGGLQEKQKLNDDMWAVINGELPPEEKTAEERFDEMFAEGETGPRATEDDD